MWQLKSLALVTVEQQNIMYWEVHDFSESPMEGNFNRDEYSSPQKSTAELIQKFHKWNYVQGLHYRRTFSWKGVKHDTQKEVLNMLRKPILCVFKNLEKRVWGISQFSLH